MSEQKGISDVLVVIPARAGSKGIPRKNLRPLAGKPLIYYSVKASLGVVGARVVVSTDDEEIALFAERFGAQTIVRPAHLAGDEVTLDPVVFHAVQVCQKKFNEEYSAVVTVQPTSPLVSAGDIVNALEVLKKKRADTVLSVVDDRHLTWGMIQGNAVPLYKERVNRQSLPPVYRETGAVTVCSREQLAKGGRIGANVQICEVAYESSFDIDTYSDFYLCEAMLQRKKIVITVVGYAEVGLGHAFRGVLLAHELVHFDIIFVCEERSDMAIEYIRSHNYSVLVAPNGELLDVVKKASPCLVINDLLDTTAEYINSLKESVETVVNFEDMGGGSDYADLVVNALYPDDDKREHVLIGEDYFCLRDEFLFLGNPDRPVSSSVACILLTFGGVDEGDLTVRTLREIADYCVENRIAVDVVVGPGYANVEQLELFAKGIDGLNYSIISKTQRISDYMVKADLAITSAGRTVLELAALKTPMLVICQNERETTHTFASRENGIVNLGFRDLVPEGEILSNVKKLCGNLTLRKTMIEKMAQKDFSKGKERVISSILSLGRF